LGDFADDAVVLHRGRLVAQGAPSELLERISADETLYLKPKVGMVKAAVELVGAGHGRVVNSGTSPMIVAVPSGFKLALLRSLLADEDLLDDVSMEPTRIESSYNRLLQKAVATVEK
jgi:ABC-type multidrug transport system ATPase subunit